MAGTKQIDGLTAKQRRFLAAYRVCLSIIGAVRAANTVVRPQDRIAEGAHYAWLKHSEDYRKGFYEAHQEAAGALEAEAIRRAVEGERDLVTYQGEPVFVWVDADDSVVPPEMAEREPDAFRRVALYKTSRSDALLLALLKAKLPEQYKERSAQEISGPGGGPIQTQALEIVEDANWYGNSEAAHRLAEGDAAPNPDADQPGPVQSDRLREAVGEDG